MLDHYDVKYENYRVNPVRKYRKEFFKFWKWDIFNFSKASIIMTFWGYIVIVLFSDVMGIPVKYSFWITLPITYLFRYFIYKKFWKDKKET